MKQTTDYSIFKIKKGNRTVNTAHVQKIKDSLNKHTYLPSCPIICDKDMNVIDGQHRLQAAKELGIAVYYIIEEKPDADLLIDLNITQRKWSTTDYITYYANEKNNVNYQRLAMAVKEIPFDVTTVLSMAFNKEIGGNFLNTKVKTGLSKYIEDVFTNLKESEKRNKKFAFWLYLVSIISLLTTIITAFIFVANRDWQTANIEYMIAYGVTCLFIIIILISLSKLLFTLAKSFMVEAIRCSDRIHAISFGKFFLDAYGAEASREEVLKAFSSWNIDNGSTSFRTQSGEDYDPKITDIISVLKK